MTQKKETQVTSEIVGQEVQKNEIKLKHYASLECIKKLKEQNPNARIVLPNGKEV